MKNLVQIKNDMVNDANHWVTHLMDFVDDFRYYQEPAILQVPFKPDRERIDAILASTVETLCAETGLEAPVWIQNIPACRQPWFVSGLENLKAIALVESPVFFRLRKIFVLGNFLNRV